MSFELLGDPGFHRELSALPAVAQDQIRAGLAAFVSHPLEHPKATRLHGSRYPGSFRLRIGSHRVLGIALPGPRLIFLTAVFTKKRDSDYDQALVRHEARMAAQGPPLRDHLAGLRKRR
ncbi:MAG: type II toxin-antitoxin system RelE family toxin [Thermoplasmatota archaeon]